MRWVRTRVFPDPAPREDQTGAVSILDSSALNVIKKFGLSNHQVRLRQKGHLCL